MAGVKISGLPAAPSAQTTDIYPIVQGGVTYKLTTAQLITLLNTSLATTFLPLAGGTMSGAINMGGFKITNMADPTAAQDAVTKNYADNIAGGLNPIEGVQAASTTALTVTYSNGVAGVGATLTNADAQAALVLDGYTTVVGDRLLIKDQASTFQNGIYTVTNIGSGSTNWVLTRAVDYDTPTEMQKGDLISVVNGTVNAKSSWIQTSTIVTVGTDAVTFSAFFTPATYLQVANNLSDLANLTTALTNLGGGAAPTGTGALVRTGSPTLTTPKIITGINDTNGNAILTLGATASAVNSVELINAATGGSPVVAATGSDTNIILTLRGQGTGGAALQGKTNGVGYASGFVSETMTASVTYNSSTPITTATPTNLTSLALTAGDWDVWGNVGAAGTTVTQLQGGLNTASTTNLPAFELCSFITPLATTTILGVPVPMVTLNVSTTTTINLTMQANGTGSLIKFGTIYARRR